MAEITRVCVFCGSSEGARPSYAAAARALAAELDRRDIGLVYGGASVGLMGVLADEVLAEGGEVVGVIPSHLADREIAHPNVTRLEVVGSMHERKKKMYDLSDGFIALPGGMGTLEELCEMTTWAQLGLHGRPIALLDVDGYFEGLVAFLEHAIEERFVKTEHRALWIVDRDPASLLDRMMAHEPPRTEKWLDRGVL